MKRTVALLIAWAAPLAAAQTPAAEARTYALVSALGNRLEVVQAVRGTGSHLPPYERRTYEVGANLINRLALQGLDQTVARQEPLSRRIYLAMDPGPMRAAASDEERIAPVKAELARLDRGGWDRILVALPARRSLPSEGMASRLQGMGIFQQPLCQADSSWGWRRGACEFDVPPPSGAKATLPDGDERDARTFVAPFMYVEVWLLEPKTLAVLERGTRYGHRKLADRNGGADGIVRGEHEDFFARQIVEVVQSAVRQAAADAGFGGQVEVNEKRNLPAPERVEAK